MLDVKIQHRIRSFLSYTSFGYISPNDPARGDDDRHMLSEHLIRLITRLMFVWFIRQKKADS